MKRTFDYMYLKIEKDESIWLTVSKTGLYKDGVGNTFYAVFGWQKERDPKYYERRKARILSLWNAWNKKVLG